MQYGNCMNAAVTSGTATIKSAVIAVGRSMPGRAQAACLTFVTENLGTATGAIALEVNNMDDASYEAAVQAAAGADRTAKEAANNVGWTQHDFTASPTIPVGGAEENDLDLGVFCYARARLSYTNATNSGTMSAWFCVG